MFGIQKTARKKQSSVIFPKKRERRFVRGKAEPAAHQQRDRAPFIRSWQIVLLWISFVLVSGYQMFFSGILKVERVSIEGAGILTSEEIERVVREALVERVWAVFPQDNFVLLSTRRLERRLLGVSPLIRQVTVEKRFPDTLNISLLERGSFLFWCPKEESCFLIDEEGTLLDWSGAREEKRVPHLFLVDESGKAVSVGDHIMASEILSFTKGLPQAFLEQADVVIREHIFVPSKYADEFRIETDKGFSLRISTEIPIEQTLNTLRIVREKAIPQERKSDLVSVDLRIPGKAFYQLRNETMQETTSVPVEGEIRMSSEKTQAE